jgi:signal peptidase I
MGSPQQSWLKVFSSAMILVLLGAVWFTLMPVQFGGRAAYAIINGNSMEPNFHRGDLVILHRASVYQINDVVTYRHPEIGPVIHRIINREGDRFFFKGDNNDWIDPYQPRQAEIIGKLWLHIPSAGKALEQVRTPWGMALLAVIIVGPLVFTPIKRSQHQSRRRKHARRSSKEQAMSNPGSNKTDILLIVVTLVLGAVALAIFTFTRPLTNPTSSPLTYEQRGTFSYSAAALPGIYTSDTVQTGEPIFRQLVDRVTVNFDYQQSVAGLPGNLPGTTRFVAQISHRSGWKWVIELQPETIFDGSTFSTSADIELAQVQAIIDNFEQQTGFHNQQYTLTVGPEVVIAGTLAGQLVHDTFSPGLTFTFDALQMQLVQGSSAVVSGTGTVNYSGQTPNTISILGLELEVATARQLAVAGLVLAVGALVIGGGFMLWGGPSSEGAQLQAKYGSLLVTVQNMDLGSESKVIEVVTLDDLAKIAQRVGCMILHQPHGSTQHYVVQDGEITYRYQFIEDGKNPAMTRLQPSLGVKNYD